jgi:Mg2+-importing ATPase
MLSATLVVFSLRTWLPFTRSRPSRALLIVTGVVWLVTLAIPYSPVAGPLGFKALPPLYLLAVVVAYFASAELTKRWFYRERSASARQF